MKQKWLAALLLWAAGFFAGVLPATLHNYLASGDFVLTAYQGGSNFYIGNHEGASGGYVPLRMGRHTTTQEKLDAVSIAETESGKKLKPSEVSDFWLQKSLRFITRHPGQWLALMAHKTLMFHGNAELEDTVDISVFSAVSPLLRLAFVPFGAIMALAVCGILISLKNWRKMLLLYLLTLGSAASVIIFFIFSRYRVPTVVFYILFASLALDRSMELAVARKFGVLAKLLGLFAFIFFITIIMLKADPPVASYNNLGVKYAEMRDFNSAVVYFAKAVDHAPPGSSKADYRHNLAKAQAALGNYHTAVQTMRPVMDFWRQEELANREPFVQDEFFAAQKDFQRLLDECGMKAESDEIKADTRRKYQELVKDYEAGRLKGMIPVQTGLCYAKIGEHAKALLFFDTALKENPNDAKARINKGLSLVALNRPDDAFEEFTAAAALEPKNGYAQQLLGNVHFQKGKLEDALRCWQRSLQLESHNPDLVRNVHVLEEQLKTLRPPENQIPYQ